MIIGKIFRVLLYSAFILIYGFVFSKHFLSSSARGGLLDTYLFVSSSPLDINNYKAGDYHTALGLWMTYGLELPSLTLEDIYRIAYQKKFEGKDEYLINEKIICVSNDSSCREYFITTKAVNDRNYMLLMDILLERFGLVCERDNFICGSLKSFVTQRSLDNKGEHSSYLRGSLVIGGDSFIRALETGKDIAMGNSWRNKDQVISYLPLAGYHLDKIKRGGIFLHEVFPNKNENFSLYKIMARGEAFENFTIKKTCKQRGKELLLWGMAYTFDQDVEDIDMVFVKTSYGRGFPYTSAYGPLNGKKVERDFMRVNYLKFCYH